MTLTGDMVDMVLGQEDRLDEIRFIFIVIEDSKTMFRYNQI